MDEAVKGLTGSQGRQVMQQIIGINQDIIGTEAGKLAEMDKFKKDPPKLDIDRINPLW